MVNDDGLETSNLMTEVNHLEFIKDFKHEILKLRCFLLTTQQLCSIEVIVHLV